MSTNDQIAGRLAKRLGTISIESSKCDNRTLQQDIQRSRNGPHIRIEFDDSGCAVLESTSQIAVRFPSVADAHESILGETRLLHGIGHCHAARLRDQGFPSIPKLCGHPRWGDDALSLLEQWGDPPDPRSLFRTLGTWLPSSHRLFLDLLAILPRERLLFFDLETLGLSNAPIFLLATARLTDSGLRLRQTIVSSLAAETSLLFEMRRELETTDALVSYNGKSFDWPLIQERSAYYGLSLNRPPIHVDLLHISRRTYHDLPDHRLGTIERDVLGTGRTDDLPSALIPEIYTRFLSTGQSSLLSPILEHNRRDVESLALLLAALLRDARHD